LIKDFFLLCIKIRPTYKVDDKLFVKNLFSYLDQEKKGAINFQDFQRVSVLFDDDLEEAELKEYFDEFKKNASKRVTFNG
jgi:Ca2+-binding EF-hand superfamily protein